VLPQPRRGDRSSRTVSVAPPGLPISTPYEVPRLTPWATFWRRSAALVARVFRLTLMGGCPRLWGGPTHLSWTRKKSER